MPVRRLPVISRSRSHRQGGGRTMSHTLTDDARAIMRDLEIMARNAAARRSGAAAQIARQARDARRDAMAEIAEVERQVIRKRSL